MIEKLTHFDAKGQAIMVDVTHKEETSRTAVAKGRIRVSPETLKNITSRTAVAKGTICVNRKIMEAVTGHSVKKGDVLGVARVAGIMAVKRTSELIPMCHPLMLCKCSVYFRLDREQCEVEAICTASLKGQTGVEMEALTGVSVALLTIYDMCKAIDKRMEITDIHLVEKTGGKSGEFHF